MALTTVPRDRLGSHRGGKYWARHPRHGPSNEALFGLPVPGQEVGRTRQRWSQHQGALRCRAADFNSQISLETKPTRQSSARAPLTATLPESCLSFHRRENSK